MAPLHKFSISAALSAALVLQPAPASALNVIVSDPPSLNWNLVINALSDGRLDAGDLVGVGFDALWSATGDAIAQTQICREAYARFYSNRNSAAFTFDITVTHQGSPPAAYAQPVRVVPQPNGTLVVGIAKGDGGYAKIFRCGGDGAANPQQEDPSAIALLAHDWLAPDEIVEATRESRGGADIRMFDTDHGSILVYLPDDIRVGDRISGTVFVEPEGEDETQRRANADRLRGYVVDVGGARRSVADRRIRFIAAGAAVVSLLDRGGRTVGQTEVPVTDPLVSMFAGMSTYVAPTQGPEPGTGYLYAYDFPAITQAGRPAVIGGVFDGDATTTSCTINRAPCPILAESPRQTVFMAPDAPTGPVNIQVREGVNSAQGVAHNIGISLSAGRLILASGERTTVTMRVDGADGIRTPIQVRLWASPSVRLQGGNQQFFLVSPNTDDGVFLHEFQHQFELRVLAPGPFDVTAELAGPVCAAPVDTPAQNAYRRALQNVRSALQRAEDAMRALIAARRADDDALIAFGDAYWDYLNAVYANRDDPSAENRAAVRRAEEAREQAERRARDARAAVDEAEENHRDAQREAEQASQAFRDSMGGVSAAEREAIDAQERAREQQQRCPAEISPRRT